VGGYKTTCFSSGKEAIMKAADCQPDLILLDVMMPDIDGLTTLRKLRTETPLKDVPIVFMSARIQAAEVRGYLRDGATAVIEKPFNPMTLPDHIAEIWQKWQERN
jgi:CheY-like chemotaxis protein